MNKTVCWNGIKYHFIAALPQLDGGSAVICADGDGKRYACTEKFWQEHPIAEPAPAAASAQSAAITTGSSAQEKIMLFQALFRGRDDLYAKRYCNTKTGKTGYTPVCANEWVPGVCNKGAQKCPDCPNRAFLPLSYEAVKAHLMGRDAYCRDVAAIYPMREDSTTWLLAVDFDEGDWQKDVTALRQTCTALGVTPAVERSRSGKGAHVWLFFSEPVTAAAARQLGSGLLTQAMMQRHELSFASYDRLFPSQDTMPKGGFGNLIALPFQGRAQRDGNTLFVDEQFVPYSDQWAYLSALPKITPQELTLLLQKLCDESDIGTLAQDSETSKKKPLPRKAKRQPLTRLDFPTSARILLSEMVYIDKQGFSQVALNRIKRLAAFRNPDFYKKQAMRLRIYNTPRIIDCGEEDENFLAIPRGCAEDLFALLDENEVPYTLEDERTLGRGIAVDFKGQLRPEQAPAADALLAHDIGVLSATTAFGKTVIGAWLIAQHKVNTLILVHSSALLEQWEGALNQFLSIDEPLPETPKTRGRKKVRHLIGKIGSGKNTRSGIVDIAIMQSLFEGDEKDVKPFVTEYGMVIVDECHHVAAFTFEKILKKAAARYVYGLSATPSRPDGHQPIIYMQCGPVRYRVDAKEQAERRTFTQCMVPRFTPTRLPDAKGIQDIYTALCENRNRNEMIVGDAIQALAEKRTPILLTQRREHAEVLAEMLKGTAQHLVLLIGSASQKEKHEKLAALKGIPAEETLLIVATGKYVGEGFDEPRLDTLLLAMPIAWKGTLAQYAGRLHRSYAEKREVRIFDYVDIHVPVLERMYHKRLRGYAELGYTVQLQGQPKACCKLYSTSAYLADFTADLAAAGRSIVIASQSISRGGVETLLPTLRQAISAKAAVTVYTKSPVRNFSAQSTRSAQQNAAAAVELLRSAGVTVTLCDTLQQHFAVLDQSIVWYGDADLLSYFRHGEETAIIRFESADIAGEIL